MNKKQFNDLIALASKPLTASKGKQKRKKRDGDYSDKRTRQRNVEGTSEKQHGKSR